MKQPDLLREPIQKLFIRYLFPSISATLVTSIYILADTVMIGRGVGPSGIAALNLLLPLFSLFFGTGMLFGVGGGVLISVSRGRGDEKSSGEYFSAALAGTAAAAFVYVACFQLFFDQVTKFLGSNETMGPLVEEYGRILIWGAPVFMMSALFQALVRNDGAPKAAMTAVIAGGVSNVVLDYLFIFPLHLGMAGGAAASVAGASLTLGILLLHLKNSSGSLKPAPGLKLRKAGQVAASGLASFLLEMSNGIVMFLFNRQLLNYVGDLGVVVYGIISNSALIVSSVCNGISQAAQPLLAVNYGGGERERLRETRNLGTAAAAFAGVLFMSVGLLFPGWVTAAFVKPTKEIMAMSLPAVRLYFLSFLFIGLNLLSATYFQSVMKPGFALLICLLRGLALSGVLVFVLPAVMGVTGIWLTMPAAEAATLAVCLCLLRNEKQNFVKKLPIN